MCSMFEGRALDVILGKYIMEWSLCKNGVLRAIVYDDCVFY